MTHSKLPWRVDASAPSGDSDLWNRLSAFSQNLRSNIGAFCDELLTLRAECNDATERALDAEAEVNRLTAENDQFKLHRCTPPLGPAELATEAGAKNMLAAIDWLRKLREVDAETIARLKSENIRLSTDLQIIMFREAKNTNG